MFLNCCPRGDNSRTLKIARAYIETLGNSGANIKEKSLTGGAVRCLDAQSFDESGRQLQADADEAAEFAAADGIVFDAPYWEFLFPAAASCYFEAVSVPGVTFAYTDTGSRGLCRAERFTYIYTSGDSLREGDKINELYLRRLTRLYGIPEFTVVSAEGLDLFPEKADEIIDAACNKTAKRG